MILAFLFFPHMQNPFLRRPFARLHEVIFLSPQTRSPVFFCCERYSPSPQTSPLAFNLFGFFVFPPPLSWVSTIFWTPRFFFLFLTLLSKPFFSPPYPERDRYASSPSSVFAPPPILSFPLSLPESFYFPFNLMFFFLLPLRLLPPPPHFYE